jgi:hypothetical protein
MLTGYLQDTISPKKFQAFARLFFLQLLIPDDNHFEPGLSLAMDTALVAFEGAAW